MSKGVEPSPVNNDRWAMRKGSSMSLNGPRVSFICGILTNCIRINGMSSRISDYQLHDYRRGQRQPGKTSGAKFCSSDRVLNHVKVIGSMTVSHLVSRLMRKVRKMRTTEFAHQVDARPPGLRAVRS